MVTLSFKSILLPTPSKPYLILHMLSDYEIPHESFIAQATGSFQQSWNRQTFGVPRQSRGFTQGKLIESTDLELIEFNENMGKAFECPRCHWQGVLGG